MTLQSVPITLDTGNYSLSELEEAIAKIVLLYEHPNVSFDAHKNSCDELQHVGHVLLDFANKHAPGGSSDGVAVNTNQRKRCASARVATAFNCSFKDVSYT